MAGVILGGRVDDDVGAEIERLLKVGGKERIVDDGENAAGLCGGGNPADVRYGEKRVRRALVKS